MPDWRTIVRQHLRLPDLRGERESQIVTEIAGHLEDRYREALASGLSAADAERRTLQEFDWDQLATGLDSAERRRRPPRAERWADDLEQGMRRRGRGWRGPADLLQDLRLAARQIRHRPGVTLAAILSLAIAISGGAYLYSFAVDTLLQPSPAEDPSRVVRVYTAWEGSMPYGSISYPDFVDLREQVDAFQSAVVSTPLPMNVRTGDRPERIWGSLVSGEYFQTLGVGMTLGRPFLSDEQTSEGAYPVAIISHAFWQDRFAADPEIVGREIEINRYPFTIIGVAEKGFFGDSVGLMMQLWVPTAMHEIAAPILEGFHDRDDHVFRSIIARLEPGAGFQQAQQQVAAVREQLARSYPGLYTGKSYRLFPEREASLDPLVRQDFVGFLSLGFVMVALVLLLASSNVAGLLLARSAGRTRELAIRMALGAGKGRLIRTLAAESLVLAGFAGVLALVFSLGLNAATAGLDVPLDMPLSVSSGTLLTFEEILFILAATVVTTFLIGLTPALQTLREDLVSALKSGEGSASRPASLARRLLVTVQVAVSFTLLAGGGMVLIGMQHMKSIDPGFDPDHQLVVQLDLTIQRYGEEEGLRFYQDLEERLLTHPDVESVGVAFSIPLSLSSRTHGMVPEGYEIPEGERLLVDVNSVDAGYFEVMRIPLREGRFFTSEDDDETPPVVIVNEAFRDRFWPGRSAIGRRVRHGDTWYTVVGMVATGKYLGLGEDPRPYCYYCFNQDYNGMMNLHIRTPGDPLALVATVRSEIARLDPTLPIGSVNTMRGRTSFALMPYRVATGVMWVFGLLSVLLASIGLYGLVSYFVNRQRHEIGVRMALGAGNRQVLRLVVGRGLRVTLYGLGIGLILALAAATMVGELIPGLGAVEPLALGIPLLLLAAITLAASYVPARQATRISPVETLRIE